MTNIVLPSSLFQQRDESVVDASNRTFKNTSLKQGIVLAVYDVEDRENITKLGPEYDVMCVEQDGQNGINTTIYKNCINSDGFGGQADFFQAKLRPVQDPIKTQARASFLNETGSMVLLLCFDGISEKAVIIKSIPNPSKKLLTKDKGLHAEGEFNGVNYQINKDGELTVTFKSATKPDGTPTNKEAMGTYLKVDKDGSFEVNDNNKESIRIDKKNKTIDTKAEKDISSTTDANFNVTAKENISFKAAKDLLASLEGKIEIIASQPSSIRIQSEMTVDAPTIKLQGQDMIMAKANQVLVLANQTLIGNGAIPAVVPTTMTIGVGNLGGMVISYMMGPYSSSVSIGI